MVQSESRTKITDGIFEIRERFFRSHLFPVGTRHLDEAVHLPDRRNEVGDERLQLPIGIIRFLPLFLSPLLRRVPASVLCYAAAFCLTKLMLFFELLRSFNVFPMPDVHTYSPRRHLGKLVPHERAVCTPAAQGA